MSFGAKVFTRGIIAGLAGYAFGLWLIGGADIQYFTSSGTIDMTDLQAVYKALEDPTFNSTTSWGNIKLDGDWSGRLPILLAAILFVLAAVLLNIFRKKE